MKKSNKRQADLVMSIVIFVITYFVICPPGKQYSIPLGDAGDYWARGIQLWEGAFSFKNIDGFRGYFWPLLLGLCNQIGGYQGFAIINAFVITIYFVYILPLFCGKKDNIIYNKIGVCVVYGLFAITFWGLFRYPLSDMMALILCTLSVLFMERAIENTILSRVLGNALLAGSFIYLAYNTRTIYMFAGITLVLYMFLQILVHKKAIKYFITILLGNLIGGCAMAIPQMYMNWKNLGIISGKVPTNGLMLQQLFWGIQYQRYDTYIGSYSVHQNPQVYFADPIGTAILEKLNIDNFYSWGDYIKTVIRYPVSIIGIYVRHLVNILLPCWPSIYITDLDNFKIVYALISYTICFIIVVALLRKYISERKTLLRFIPLLVPMLFILPGAVEVRFFIAGYVMSFCLISFFINWKELLEYIRTNVWKMIILYLGAGSIMLSMWSSFLGTELENGIFM